MDSRSLVTEAGLEFLQKCLGFIGDGPRDMVFIAIDFEHLENIQSNPCQDLDYQVGIAILDTRRLISNDLEDTIQTYNLVTGSPSYCAYTARRFLFGKTIQIDRADLISDLNMLIPRSNRQIVLVGHDIRHDLTVLRRLNFDLQTSISGILDTRRIASVVFAQDNMSLVTLLTRLRCPWNKLHNAGNDANFSIRALLLLAIEGSAAVDYLKTETLVSIKTIALQSIPHKLTPDEKALQKKRKRYERSLKYHSKSRNSETQEQIRIERALRRQAREERTQNTAL